MPTLELKIPPDVVALVVAALMWLISKVTPSLTRPVAARGLLALILFVAGMALIVAARVAFARANTTFSPMVPERSRELVTTGIYRLTRNPMYLGTLLALLALAALLSNAAAGVVAMGYVAYISRYQIQPEERVLHQQFGSRYDSYRRTVRRWL